MKKTIELSLKAEGEFFTKLKDKFLEHGELGISYDASPLISQIICATIKTLDVELKDQKPNYLGLSKFNFEKKENVYPEFHNLLKENIDKALNKKVHRTTLERFCDLIEGFMVETANQQADAKKVTIEPLISSQRELEAITNYVTSTWDGFDKVNASEFFSKVWKDVTELTKNKFDEHAFHNLIVKLRDDYPSNSEPKLINNKIESSDLVIGIVLGRSSLSNMVNNNWDYEKNVNTILSEVKKQFPDTGKLKPKGWSKMAKGYSDYEGMSDLDHESLRANFKGMNSSTAGASSFEVRVSLPHVMYDDKCQGRKPLEVLVGAILGHAYVMAEQNNSSKMLTEWVELSNKLKASNAVEFNFKEPLNQALYEMIASEKFEDNNPKVLNILGIETSKKKLKP